VVPCAGVPIPEPRLRIHVDEPGVAITGVVPDTPADRAGLQEGDVIVAVDEVELDGENDLADVIATYEPGDTVTLEVRRPGEESREVAVELGEHPEEEGVAYLGIVPCCGSFGPGREVFVRMIEAGASITGVEPDGPADQAGLMAGDVILQVDDEPTLSARQMLNFVAGKKPGEVARFTLLRGEDTLQINVIVAERPAR